jgi:transcriptional regulator with XRE-family HTH domain
MRKSIHSSEYAGLRKRLAGMRTDAGLTQRRLAKLLDAPPSWVAKVELGERRIDLVEFAWFCEACGSSAATEAGELLRRWARPRTATILPKRRRRA